MRTTISDWLVCVCVWGGGRPDSHAIDFEELNFYEVKEDLSGPTKEEEQPEEPSEPAKEEQPPEKIPEPTTEEQQTEKPVKEQRQQPEVVDAKDGEGTFKTPTYH